MASSSSSSSSAVSRISNLRRHLHPSHSSSDNKGAGLIKVSPEVSEALSNGRAVVALESTIISHGMPYPLNLETAQEVEANVRENGAVPATIAILDGIPCVGLSQEELGRLATLGKQAQKTFEGTLHMLWPPGEMVRLLFLQQCWYFSVCYWRDWGVHRHGEDSLDISSDLTELGRTPVAVISAGVKSILDIPTLEYLETQEFVLLLTGQMSFQHFSRKQVAASLWYEIHPGGNVYIGWSGQWMNRRLYSYANIKLKLGTGILIAVPIPREHSASGSLIESAIQIALKEARDKNITGNAETPFLLSRVNELTGGASLSSNIALVKNNALVGAEIAVALTQLRDRCTRDYYVQATEYLLSAKIVYAADEHVRKLVIVAIHSAALSFLTVTLSEQ
ncbi:hypothetical protein FNV43_RR04731 [Rhamnella rubrinervis]|uniref:Pseudouridine-5'-phosphate glycosidase n=1 Tax=Rhamnella rubrinervis TaxID=2594499 RepID=A0A8K0HLB0_9ROSA|nr:hypothetical protein FNV43_RR04731 [Rhamnella rubrinervis]